MARINKVCPGNCADCTILTSGEVQMIPCILDQIFQRQIKLEAKLDSIIESNNNQVPALALDAEVEDKD